MNKYYVVFTSVAGNWEDIKYQICYSNVIQRDNLLFARRLDKSLVMLAKEKAKEVIGTKINTRKLFSSTGSQQTTAKNFTTIFLKSKLKQ